MADARHDAATAHERRRWRRRFGRWLRLVLVVVVFAVGVEANRELGLDGPASAYSSLQAFALGLDVPPDPVALAAGGWAPAAFWTTRWLAPLLAAESILFLALLGGLIDRPRLLLVDHVVVVGAGPVGRAIAEHLIHEAHAKHEHLEVVVVEREQVGKHLDHLRELGVWIEVGDPTASTTLASARVDRARAVVVATGDDVVNVAVTLALIGSTRPRGTAWIRTQVARDEHEHLHASAASWLGERGATEVERFKLFEEAAKGLVRACRGRAVIAGYGRLGHAILAKLRDRPVLVVDRHWSDVPVRPGVERAVGDVESDETVRRIVAFAGDDPTTVYVCTDDDVRNLELALQLDRLLSGKKDVIRLVTRMLHPPPGALAALEHVGACDLADVVAATFGDLVRREARSPLEHGLWTLFVRAFGRLSRHLGAA